MMITWLSPLDLADREAIVREVRQCVCSLEVYLCPSLGGREPSTWTTWASGGMT